MAEFPCFVVLDFVPVLIEIPPVLVPVNGIASDNTVWSFTSFIYFFRRQFRLVEKREIAGKR